MNIQLLVLIVILAAVLYRFRSFFFYLRGLRAFKKNRKDRTAVLLTKAASMGMKPKHRLTTGYILLSQGSIEEADRILTPLRGVREKGFNHQEAGIYCSLLLWKKGMIDEAVSELEELLAGGYKTTTLYTNLGFYLQEKGDLDRALELNLEAREYNEDSKGILDNLGAVRILREEWDLAAPLYEKLMTMSPTFPEAFYHAALVHRHRGEDEKALQQLKEGEQQTFTELSTVGREAFAALRAELEDREISQ